MGIMGQGILEFEKDLYDFGQIKEQDGATEYSFLFVNVGDQPLQIRDVKASCGCTTSFWTKEEILPGDSGRVTALYSVTNRPGAFTKSLRVTSNASNANVSLFIKGHVIPKSRYGGDDLSVRFGSLRLKNKFFNLGKITTEKAVTREFEVYNDSDSVVSFLVDDMELPEYLSVEFDSLELQPKERGLIKIIYDPVVKNELGYQMDGFILKTSEPTEGEKAMNVVLTIEEYFPPMTEEELENAPKLTLTKKSHDFRKVAKDAIVETDFVLINEGKSELNIRSMKANCDCVISILEKNTLQPGEKVKMKVKFDANGRIGKQFKSITIFSNDPVSPSQMVMIMTQVGG